MQAILKDENFENIRFSLEERRNHVTLVCQNITYETTFWEEHNGTNFVDVPSKLGFISITYWEKWPTNHKLWSIIHD